ncbi:hypothetical protein [Agrobacterium leguminum]|uniref:hypothetical protein n=1 Tax=Agrobacterium TaxID=357 RepID=UPI003C761C82
MFQTMIAELQQRTFDAQWSADFPPTGRYVSVRVDNRSYWHFDQPDGKGGQKRRYVGPADDDEITNRVETFRGEKDDYQNQRKMAAALTREAGLVTPDRFTGQSLRRWHRPVYSGSVVSSSAQSRFNVMRPISVSGCPWPRS